MDAFWQGAGMLVLYFAVLATVAILCRVFIRIPDEVFRKILHCILLGSLLVFVFAFEHWWMAALTSVGFAVVVYPILVFFEHFPGFSRLTTERSQGELKHSLLLVFSMFAVVIGICWGALKDPYLVLASIYAWGFGDAAAALIGKRFGSHKLRWRFLDGKKTAEGSAAMFLTAWVCVLVILLLRGGLPILGYILIPLVTAAVSAAAELVSRGGMDTVICPLSAMAVLILMMKLLGGGA